MGNFNQRGGGFGGNRGGGSRFGGGDRGGRGFGGGRGGDRGEVTMTQVTCDDCKKSCEVPFKPTGDKPIYCKECFANHGGGRSDFRSEGPSRFPKRESSFAPRRDFNAAPSRDAGRGDDGVKKAIESINYKLDKLVSAIENLAKSNSPKKEVATFKEVVKEVVKTAPVSKAKKVAKKKPSKK